MQNSNDFLENPLIQKLISLEEVFWLNPLLQPFQAGIQQASLTEKMSLKQRRG